MLSTLRINGFRGIKDCEIKGLKTINVFIGRNNHGKSSILEALYLASAAFDFEHPFERARGDRAGINKIRYLLNRRSRRGLSWGRGKETLWYRYDTHNPLTIEIKPRKHRKVQIELLDWHLHPLIDLPHRRGVLEFFKRELGLKPRVFPHICLIESRVIGQRGKIAKNIEQDKISKVLDAISSDFVSTRSFMEKMMFIDANLLHEMERVEKTLWTDLLKERRDKLVTEILRSGYEVDVEDVTYIPIGDTYQLAVKLPKTTIRVDDLGDGARYSMIWIMVAALARNTAILIEEPESHQHPGGLAKTLEMLSGVMKKNKIQLFATTHSLEFIKLTEKIAEEKKINMATFFIEMDENGKIEPRSITPKDSDNLEKMGLDLRFLDVI